MRSKILIALLSLSALIGAGGNVPSVASAAPELVWRVNHNMLKSGETRKAEGKNTTNILIKTTVAGVKINSECTTEKLSGALIEGGAPGRGAGALEYEGCTIKKPEHCAVKNPVIAKTRSEFVQDSTETRIYTLFSPATGEIYTEITLEGSGGTCVLAGTYPITGSVLAEISPEKEEVLSGKVILPTTALTKYKNLAKEEKTAGLSIGGNPVTMSGQSEGKLESGEIAGVF
ncbi:MAG TPA: hypothetical protein VG053_11945 [Solirubrobacteraceae bacterium]|jgi:hypothetical protein|nr:hypothetical protein [Solirubrobacteraceae bacterium]